MANIAVRSVDVFAAIKDTLPASDVLEHYGVHVQQGKACCPFHNDKSPSMRVYQGNRGWWCFACGMGGDVIDFVGRLLGLNPLQAARQLDSDFGLRLFDGPAPDRGIIIQLQQERDRRMRELEAYRNDYMNRIAEAREIRALMKLGRPSEGWPFTGEYAALMGRLEYLEDWFGDNKWR